jgi:hypothetical protein
MLHAYVEDKAEILYKDSLLKNELNASLFPPAIMEYSNESINDTFISEKRQQFISNRCSHVINMTFHALLSSIFVATVLNFA